MCGRENQPDEAAVSEALEAANRSDWQMKMVFTTGEVAEVCRISQQTVIRCFDSGKLKGFRVPGSKFRRIPRESLVDFMKAHKIPLENLDSGRKRVLVVDDDADILAMLESILSRDGRFEVKSASNGFDAGALSKEFRPDIVLLDYMLPDINGNVVCQRIRGDKDLADTKIIIVSGAVDPTEVKRLREAGADAFIKKPFDMNQLISSMTELLSK
ncbi:MAG: response regulator [Phycisphaerales bacterium]|nr:response regulator [Phycisphaerales bacterium]